MKIKKIACFFKRHKYWEREPLLIALAYGQSKRCRVCNRLVLKNEFRTTVIDQVRLGIDVIRASYGKKADAS